MSRTKKNNIVLGVLCAVVLLMVVGYAAFSTILNINGTSAITSNWNVKITNITSKDIVGGASNASTPSYTDLTATFSVNLISPGDSITYDVTVTNAGTIDAELDKITISDSNNPAIIFSTSGLSEGSILTAGNSEVLTVTVTYSSGVSSQPSLNTSSLTVTLDYVQPGTGSGSIVIDSGGTLKAGALLETLMPCSIYFENIQTLTFKTDLTTPNNVVSTCDIGEEPGTVTLWTDSENNAIIGADGMVVANADSSMLFAGMQVETINGLENLDTSNVIIMAGMFVETSNLTTLNLSNFDTSNVTNMMGMFYGMSSKTSLDLSNFDTSNVTDMNSMFYGMTNLTSLNVSSFDTTKVTDMAEMFVGSRSLTSLDLSNFNTSNVTDMHYMFASMLNLTTLNLSGFDTTKVNSFYRMFSGLTSLTNLDFRNATCSNGNCGADDMFYVSKTGATIYTKDATTRTWLQTEYPSGNYIIP